MINKMNILNENKDVVANNKKSVEEVPSAFIGCVISVKPYLLALS